MAIDCGLLRNTKDIDRRLFSSLHPDGRRLIQNWAKRGIKATDGKKEKNESYFEGFIYLWFAINGWGACIAETDRDWEWVNAVAGDPGLSQEFDYQYENNQSFGDSANRFAELWPIFMSSQIRQKNIRVQSSWDRQKIVKEYLNKGLNDPKYYQPSCWEEHNRTPPIDWPHIIKTLYRVRCNLFHGEKNLNSENDTKIVRRACDILNLFFTEMNILNSHFRY